MKRKVFGFTLIELLVVIAIIAMLAAILVPAVNKALISAGLTTTVANGKSIYTGAFSGMMDSLVLGGVAATAFPSNETTSTAYFISLVESGVLPVSYDFFSARGLKAYKSSEASDFQADGNAWNLVNYVKEPKDGTPWIYTINGPPDVPMDKVAFELADIQPFGRAGMVVVLKGGSSFALKGNQVTGEYMNPAQQQDADLDVVGPE